MSATQSDSTLLVHKVCNSQLTGTLDGPLFCEVCDSSVGPGEMTEADNSPGTLSG